MAYKNTGGVYANMEFPPYEFREYPKLIPTGPHGAYQIVSSQREENELLDSLGVAREKALAAKAHGPVDPQKEILIARASELGVPINKQWSMLKLQAVISAAEAAVDELPPEGEEIEERIHNKLIAAADEKVEEISNFEDDKTELVARAKELGISSASRIWGVPRLKSAIAEAEAKSE
jgi:hypothetical protein